MTATYAPGDVVRIVGQPKARYTVRRVDPDGTAALWGGTPMRERYRHVVVERLRPAEGCASTNVGSSTVRGATKSGAGATAQTAPRRVSEPSGGPNQ